MPCLQSEEGSPVVDAGKRVSEGAAVQWNQLIRQCLAGVGEAWETLCREAYGDVYRRLLAMTRDPDLSSDLAQETFLRLLKNGGEKLKTFDPDRGTPFPTYLRVVASNVFRSWMSGSGRDAMAPKRRCCEVPVDLASEKSPSVALDWREVESMIESLPPSARTCIVLYACGFSYKEIGSVVGMTPGGVAAAIWRGRRNLDCPGDSWLGKDPGM